MTNRIEKLTKRASEIAETKKELKAQGKINTSDLSIIKELLNIPLEDDASISEIRSLSNAVEIEKKQLEEHISLNNEEIAETLDETDDFIRGLENNVRTLERMEKTSDLVDVSRHIRETESRIDELEEVKRILGMDSPNHSRGAKSFVASEYSAGVAEKAEARDIAKDGTEAKSQTSVQIPRNLTKTGQDWQNVYGSKKFNNPEETAKKLDCKQGKVPRFEGTCGLVSIVNILRMAGVNVSEAEVVQFASNNPSTYRNLVGKNCLCHTDESTGNDCSRNGGTDDKDRAEILHHFGLSCRYPSPEATIENVKNAVIEGRGVILSVDAGILWKDWAYRGKGHAVTVTSVMMNGDEIEGFWICDSGRGEPPENKGADYYPVEVIEAAMTGRKLNVTNNIIR